MSDTKNKKGTTLKKSIAKIKDSKSVLRLLCIICVIIVFCGGFFAYSAVYDDVFPRVSVCGVPLGGLSQAEAEAKIKKLLSDSAEDREITFKCKENFAKVMLSDLKTEIDSIDTAKTAFEWGRDGGTFSKTYFMLKTLFGGKEVPLSVTVDEAAFETLICDISKDYEIPVQDAGYHIEENILTITKGHPGKVVDRQKAKGLLRQAVESKEISQIELLLEDKKPGEIDLDKFYNELTGSPQDAEYTLTDGEIVIVDEKPSVNISKDELKKAFESKEDEYSFKVEVTMPKKTAEDLKEMLFRDVLGSFSSNFATSTEARAHNVRLTAQRVDGYILMPGDVFSYDKTVGRRTAENGYREAGVYIGNKVESGIGGGICQTSSTLYSAALYANLEIVSRTSHSLPVSYVPAGQDATIAEGYIDLKIKNNTEYPIRFEAKANGRTLNCRILGVKVPDQTVELYHQVTANYKPETEKTANPDIPKGYKKIIEKGSDGYSVASKRVVKQDGEIVKEEKLTNSLYRAASIEIEVNPQDLNIPEDTLKIYDEEEYKKEQEAKKAAETVQENKPEEEDKNSSLEELQPESMEDDTENIEITDVLSNN